MSASPFKFGAKTNESMGSFSASIPIPITKNLHIKTHILPVNMAFLIGLSIFMKHCITMVFEQH